MSLPAWRETVDNLDIDDETKGKAISMIISMPKEDRDVFVSPTPAVAKAAILARLSDAGPSGTWGGPGSADMKLLLVKLTQLAVVRELTSKPAMVYTPSAITQNRDPDFRRRVLIAYGYTKNQVNGRAPELPCLILDSFAPGACNVPKWSLIAGHLFKLSFGERASQYYMKIRINDSRNGMPLFKPLEFAFDTMDICILVEKEDRHIVRVTNTTLLRTTLGEYIRCHNLYSPSQSQQMRPDVLAITFGQLDKIEICFCSEHLPYKRCLYYHAKQAVNAALSNGWTKPNDISYAAFYTPSHTPPEDPTDITTWLAQSG